MTPSTEEVTRWLVAWSEGDEEALARLIPLVHGELRRLARRYIGRERRGHTLQTTALVNEAYLRLIDAGGVRWQNRAHFFAIAARLMRQILIDYAWAQHNGKRGGDTPRVSLEEAATFPAAHPSDLVALDAALSSLAALDERKSRVVELRFFGGLTVEETAEVLSVSPDTIRRDWRLAKTWLLNELERGGGSDEP